MWTPFQATPSFDSSSFQAARVLSHWLAQIVAAAGTTHIEVQSDFSHTTLRWEPRARVLAGQNLDPTRNEDNSIRAGLKLSTLELLVLQGSTVCESIPLPGMSFSSALQWLSEALARSLKRSPIALQRPEHDLPQATFAKKSQAENSQSESDIEIPLSTIQDHGPALAQLEQWLANADQLLTGLIQAQESDKASPLRIWPHHFDMATLLNIETPSGEEARSIGVGLSLGDSSYDQPYWYVTPWPYPEVSSITEALRLGHWHTQGFVAAILDSQTLFEGGVEGQGLRSEHFLYEAIAACRRILSQNPRKPSVKNSLVWYKAADLHELPEGRVKSLSAGLETICLTHHKGCYAALNNACPHQGGPLGEGSIEKGWLRCPWHGWDFDPLTGQSPEGLEDGLETYPVELREDGIYVGVEPALDSPRTATDVMAETMVHWGVKWVFGMVGHSNLGLSDAIRRQVEAGQLGYIGIRHEGAASFAVSAYGKLTGRPAACLAIAGPGATNLLTGLWDAHIDRAPALALTGQVQSQVLGRGAFQEIDLKAAYGGVAQWTATVLHHSPFAELMSLACKQAILKRGVSHLIFPDEVQTKAAPQAKAGTPQGRMPDLDIAPSEASLDAAEQAIRAAKRPVIIVGHGARFAMEAIISLAAEQGMPIITTFKGKGLISDHHPLAGGVLGRSGTPVASWLMNEADLLVVLGASFSNHTGITSYKPILQVDFEAEALGRRHKVTVPVYGEIGITVGLLQKRLQASASTPPRPDPKPEVAERWKIWRAEKQSRLADDRGQGLNSATIFAALNRLAPEDAIITIDVGNNAYSFGRYFEVQRQSILMSGYLGSIGFALPAAMGAWVATQESDARFAGRKVISVSGDGGLGQYLADFSTWVKYNMNITHIVLNNGELGKISKEQRSGHWQVWETSLCNPSFSKFASDCGALGLFVDQVSELDAALQRALEYPGPSLVEVRSDASLF